MDSVTSKIEQQILNLERGSIFFPDDFVDLGTPEAIRQSLTRLCKEGTIIRIAQGIYCYPEIEEKLGLGILQPSFEQIAEAMAKRDHARIVPTGAYALNVLGLSTQVPMNYVYLTDGSKRHVEISNGRGITFKNTAPKNLAFQSRLAMLIRQHLSYFSTVAALDLLIPTSFLASSIYFLNRFMRVCSRVSNPRKAFLSFSAVT